MASEPAIEMALRHLRKGDDLIAGQIELIGRLRRQGHPIEIDEAEKLLQEFRTIQAAHVAHLERLRGPG